MADVIDRGVIEIVGDATKLRASIEDAKKSIRTLGEGQRDISKSASASIDRYIGKLQQQNATFGKSVRETELFKIALRGASQEQIKSANAALLIAERNQKAADSLKQMTADATRFGKIAGTAIAAGLTAAAVAFEVLIGKAASFQDLAEKVGDTAESLASLAVAAAVGGTNMETVGQAAIKLTKNLTAVDDEADDAGAALKSLGINIADFKSLAPTDQLSAVAEALAGFEDGAQKSAVAMALFGKAGAELLPFLKELAGETGRQNILTQEQIELADEYKDKQAKLAAQFSLTAQAIAADMLPAYTALQEAFIDTIKGIIGIDDEASQLANSTAIKDFAISAVRSFAVVIDGIDGLIRAFQIAGKTIGAYAASMERLQRFDFRGAVTAIQGLGEDVKKITDRPLFSTNLEARLAAQAEGRQKNQTPPQDRKVLDFQGKAKKQPKGTDTSRADAAAQLALDLELIKQAGDAQIDAFRNAEQIMQAMRSAQLVDDKTFYESKLAFIQTFAREEEAQLQAQIERRQKETFTGKEALQDQLKNQREIEKLQAQISKVRAETVTKEKINSIEQQAALKKIEQGYEDARIAAEQYLATIARANAREIAGVGRGQRFREDQANRSAIDDRAQAERRRLEGELRRQQISREQFDIYIAQVDDTYRKEVQLYEERTARLTELQADWMAGASEALQNYVDETRDTAKQFEELFSKGFNNLEDLILEVTSGGIKSFKDLGTAVSKFVGGIAADLARIEIREKITGPLAEALKQNLPSIGGILGRQSGGLLSGQTPPLIPDAQAREIARRFPNGIPGVGGVDVPVVESTIEKAGGAAAEAANAATFTTAVTTAGTTFATTATTAATTISAELTAASAAQAAEATASAATVTASAASFSATVIAAGAQFAASVAAAGTAGGASEGVGDVLDAIGFIGSFDKGIARVPQTGLALVHEGEAIVPKGQNVPQAGPTIINMTVMPGADMRTANQAAVETARHVQLAQGRRLSGAGR